MFVARSQSLSGFALFLIWGLHLQHVAALYSNGANFDWGDFSNNFASDLSPLLSLFGESPTKQFLSESTHWLDSVLFGLAPIGIITTLISVIRLYGSARMRSIVGRSAEPRGVAETELCSSTSNDVCELWSNGGICRVFGRPKVLAFIFTKDKAKFYSQSPTDTPTCGMQTPDEALSGRMHMRDPQWEEVKPSQNSNHQFAPNPNISLNIGVKQNPVLRAFFVIVGLVSQGGFIAFMWWTTYRVPKLYDPSKGQSPTPWAFGLSVAGTALLNLGMMLCAWLVDEKSRERVFQRIDGNGRVFWLQPGGQRVGDQVFSAFAYSDKEDSKDVAYVTSWRVDDGKADSTDAKNEPAQRLAMTRAKGTYWLAISTTLVGWVIQFLGLRGVPGVVSLVLLVITLCMTILRALVRSNRLESESNALRTVAEIEGHELDWQALMLVQSSSDPQALRRWFISAESSPEESATSEAWSSSDNFKTQGDARDWIIAKEMEEGSATSTTDRKSTPRAASKSGESSIVSGCPNMAARAMHFRVRLAQLTSTPSTKSEHAWSPEVFEMASKLQKAFDKSADYIFLHFPFKNSWKKLLWQKDSQFAWSATCEVGKGIRLPICFYMQKQNGSWGIDRNQLEAVLGLWSWSILKSGPNSRELQRKSIVVMERDRHDTEAAINLWIIANADKLQRETKRRRQSLLSVPTAIDDHLSKQAALSTSTNEEQNTRLFIATDDSLLQLMAQDLFTIFISKVVSIMQPLHMASQEEVKPKDLLGTKASQYLVQTNPHVKAVAEILVSAGVASREESLMSLVPALMAKLPDIDDSSEALLADAKTLRRQGKLKESRNLLNKLFYGGPRKMQNRVLRQLWEVYRAGVRAEPEADAFRQPAWRRGISTMESKIETMSSQEDVKAAEDLKQCYEIVLDSLYQKKRNTRPKQLKKWDPTVVAAWRSATTFNAHKRAEALMLTEDYELARCTRNELLDILEFSIAQDIPELVEDMWLVDWDLVNNEIDNHWSYRNAAGSRSRKGTPLWWAVELGAQPDTLASILDWPHIRIDWSGVTNDVGEPTERTALCLAIGKGNEIVTRSLLRKGADWWQKKDGVYPFSIAAEGGYMKIMKHLFQLGAKEIAPMMAEGLVAAVKGGKQEMAGALLQHIQSESCHYHEMARHWPQKLLLLAVYEKNRVMLDWLLSKGAKINAEVDIDTPDSFPRCWGSEGLTALTVAIANDKVNLDIVKDLVTRGADVNMECEGGNAFVKAVQKYATWSPDGDLEPADIVRFLLEDGKAIVTKPTAGGRHGTALVAACAAPRREGSNHEQLMKLVLERCRPDDIDVLVKEGDFGNALVAAAASGNTATIKALVEKYESVGSQVKEKINKQIPCGKSYGKFGSVLVAAVCTSFEPDDTCKYLLSLGAEVNMPVVNGEYGSALAAASWRPTTSSRIRMLLRAGADVNLQLDYGHYGSALLAMIIHCDLKCVKLLVENDGKIRDANDKDNRADVNTLVSRGKYEYGNALIAAAHLRRVDCVKFLLEKGARVSGVSAWGRFRTALEAAEGRLEEEDSKLVSSFARMRFPWVDNHDFQREAWTKNISSLLEARRDEEKRAAAGMGH